MASRPVSPVVTVPREERKQPATHVEKHLHHAHSSRRQSRRPVQNESQSPQMASHSAQYGESLDRRQPGPDTVTVRSGLDNNDLKESLEKINRSPRVSFSQLKICTFNIKNCRLLDLIHCLLETEADIIFLQETWLSDIEFYNKIE